MIRQRDLTKHRSQRPPSVPNFFKGARRDGRFNLPVFGGRASLGGLEEVIEAWILHIPKAWVEEVRRRVEAGREFQDAVRVLARLKDTLPGTVPSRAATLPITTASPPQLPKRLCLAKLRVAVGSAYGKIKKSEVE